MVKMHPRKQDPRRMSLYLSGICVKDVILLERDATLKTKSLEDHEQERTDKIMAQKNRRVRWKTPISDHGPPKISATYTT